MRKIYKRNPLNALYESFDSQIIRSMAVEHGGVMPRPSRYKIIDALENNKQLSEYATTYMDIGVNHDSDIQMDKITDDMIYGKFDNPGDVLGKLCAQEHSKRPFAIKRRMDKMNLKGYDFDNKRNTEDDVIAEFPIYKYKCILFNDLSFVVLRAADDSYQLQYNAQMLVKKRRERKAEDIMNKKREEARHQAEIEKKQEEWDGIFNEMFFEHLKESEGEDVMEVRFEPGTVLDQYSLLNEFILDAKINKKFRCEPFYKDIYCYLTARNMWDPARFILLFIRDWTKKHISECCGFRSVRGSGVLDFIFVNEDTDKDYIVGSYDDDNEIYTDAEKFREHLDMNDERYKKGLPFED